MQRLPVLFTAPQGICSAKSTWKDKAVVIGDRMRVLREMVFCGGLLIFAVMMLRVTFVSADRAKDSKGSLKISLEEVLSIGSLEDGALFQWVGVVSDSQKFIYVTDAMDYALKKFDQEGKLVKRAGGKGQGPGEFSAPRLLDCSDEYLFVSEQYMPVIKVFDRDLRHRYDIPLRAPVGDMKVLADDLVAVVVLTARRTSAVLFCNQKGEVVRKLEFSGDAEGVLMDMVSLDLDSQGNLYLVYNFADRIEKYSRSGKRVWSRNLLGIKKVERKKVSSFVVPTEIVYKDVALDGSGNIYVLGGELSKKRSRDVYVLSPEGEHLATFTLPEASHCIYIDAENFLYTRANEGITLKKYRMVLSREK
jgi:hypothetical protein